MMSFLCSVLISSLSSFMMFDLGGLAFSTTCLNFHLSSSTQAWVTLKAISSIQAMMSKYGICLMIVTKLRYLFSTDSSKLVWTNVDYCLYWGWWALCVTFWSFNLFNFCTWQTLNALNLCLKDLSRSCWILKELSSTPGHSRGEQKNLASWATKGK